MKATDTPEGVPTALAVLGYGGSPADDTEAFGVVNGVKQIFIVLGPVPLHHQADKVVVALDNIGIDGFILFKTLSVAKVGFMDAVHSFDKAAVEALPIFIVFVGAAIGDNMGDVTVEEIKLTLYPTFFHAERGVNLAFYHAQGLLRGSTLEMVPEGVGNGDFLLHIGGGDETECLLVVR